MATPLVNFGLVTVSGGYASGATAITLQTGDGSKLPVTTGGYRYPLTWWNATDYAHAADDPNVEIVLVTNRAGDVLTVVRGQEGTSGSNKNTAAKTYRMILGITREMFESLRVVQGTHQGLVLKTHRDSISAPKKVELVDVDYIVMNDGTVLRNDNDEWTGKTADITVSGVGGLDTGVEAAATLYEIYAIAKEDGTRNLLLHKSKRWTLDANYSSGEDASQNLRDTTSNQFIAQGFTCAGGKIVYAQAKMKKIGTPTGVLQCVIYSDAAGVPGSSICVSDALDVAKLPTTDTVIRFTFPSTAPELSASPTKYHLAIGGSWAIDGTNYVQWRMDGSAGAYANGAKALWNGTTWTTDADDDMVFGIGLEVTTGPVSLPTDYTKQCMLGWVLNDGFSNFVPFIQQGRTNRSLAITSGNCFLSTTTGSPEYMDFSFLLPPVETCIARVGFTGTGTQAGLLAIGDVSALDIANSGDTAGASAVIQSDSTSIRPGGFTEVLIRRSLAMVQGTANGEIWVSGFSW